jgi:hypothetical protein
MIGLLVEFARGSHLSKLILARGITIRPTANLDDLALDITHVLEQVSILSLPKREMQHHLIFREQ